MVNVEKKQCTFEVKKMRHEFELYFAPFLFRENWVVGVGLHTTIEGYLREFAWAYGTGAELPSKACVCTEGRERMAS